MNDYKNCATFCGKSVAPCNGVKPYGDMCFECPKFKDFKPEQLDCDLCEGDKDCGTCPGYIKEKPVDVTEVTKAGCKYDNGLVDMSYLDYFPLALEAVCKVSTFGGDKGYIRGSFADVPDARRRYTAAMFRHYFKEGPVLDDPRVDPESGLAHDFAVAWNALCRLELRLRDLK